MTTYYIYMGQGLVVDLQNDSVSSGQFSSCAPIILYDSTIYKCALYHLEGCSVPSNESTEHLRVLTTLVRPTDVYVLCGVGSTAEGFISTPSIWTEHVKPVSGLFRNSTVHTQFKGKSAYKAITVSINDDFELIITESTTADYNLNSKSQIDNLARTVKFVGQSNDKKLSLWI